MLKTYATHFCGCGGACYGLHQAGLECKLAIDYWQPAIDARAKNLGHQGLCMSVLDYVKDDSHKADLLWTSPPCQTFSTASREVNLDNKDDIRNNLFLASVKYLEYFKPKFFVLENVMGLFTHDGTKTFTSMREVFMNHGYSVEFGALNSKFWGLPQSRERSFIVGSLEGKKGLIPKQRINISAKFGDIMEKNTKKGCWGPTYKTALDKVERTQISIEVISEEDILPTITCGWGGGGTRKKVAILDKTKDGKITYLRQPTIREGARAQGFPETWEFPENETDAWQMIGNAVASPVAKAIVDHLQKIENGETPASQNYLTDPSVDRIPKEIKELHNDRPPDIVW